MMAGSSLMCKLGISSGNNTHAGPSSCNKQHFGHGSKATSILRTKNNLRCD